MITGNDFVIDIIIDFFLESSCPFAILRLLLFKERYGLAGRIVYSGSVHNGDAAVRRSSQSLVFRRVETRGEIKVSNFIKILFDMLWNYVILTRFP